MALFKCRTESTGSHGGKSRRDIPRHVVKAAAKRRRRAEGKRACDSGPVLTAFEKQMEEYDMEPMWAEYE